MEFENRETTLEGARLFVYGTLRKGFCAHKLLRAQHARFLANGHVKGRLYNATEYPGAIRSASPSDRVHGEVYFLPRAGAAFKVLDKFEGHDPARPEGNLFERGETAVTLAGGGEMQAWIYWLREARRLGKRLLSGNYEMRRT